VIDQFEELFALCHSEQERSCFIENLISAAAEPHGPVIVVITLRADFYAYCAGYVGLREALAKQQQYIGATRAVGLGRGLGRPAFARCGA
jgi:Novel STAND NTPase 1